MSKTDEPVVPPTGRKAVPQERAPKRSSTSRISNGLVAIGSAAVVAVYGAGFYQTKAEADRLSGGNAGPGGMPGPGGTGRGMAPGGPIPGAGGPQAVAGDAIASGAPVPAVSSVPSAPPVSLELPTTAPANRPSASAAPAGRTENSRVAEPATKTNTPPAVSATASAVTPAPAASSASEAPAPAAAPAPPAAPAASPAPAAAATATEVPAATRGKYKDGVYTGWGTCRHGDIQAKIEVKDGRIVTSEIAQCLTRYSCSWISPLPPQVIQRQSENVDYVSGATDSAVAFYWAVFDALSKAK